MDIDQLNKHIKEMSDLQKQVLASVNPIADAFSQSFLELAKQMETLETKMLQIAQPLADSMRSLSESFVERIKETQEYFEKHNDLLERLEKHRKNESTAFRESGWWIPPTLLEIDFRIISIAVQDYASGKRSAITLMFASFFQRDNCKNLQTMTEGWKANEYFKKWNHVIEQALEAHMANQYSLSVPALLLVIEGIANDYCASHRVTLSEVERSQPKTKILKALENNSQGQDEFILESDYFINALGERIFKHTRKVAKQARGYSHFLNRHAVLHGLTSKYGTRKNSLQCFMLLDVLNVLK